LSGKAAPSLEQPSQLPAIHDTSQDFGHRQGLFKTTPLRKRRGFVLHKARRRPAYRADIAARAIHHTSQNLGLCACDVAFAQKPTSRQYAFTEGTDAMLNPTQGFTGQESRA